MSITFALFGDRSHSSNGTKILMILMRHRLCQYFIEKSSFEVEL